MRPLPVPRDDAFDARERATLDALKSPRGVQAFLDETPYSTEPIYRCPRQVIAERRAHCLDGALFAAAALERLGYPPRVVDLRAVRDDDHVIALYEARGRLGAVSKSNMTGLRYREPVYRDLRELVMSYFEDYFSTSGERTLRSHSAAFDLRRVDRLRWRTHEGGLEELVAALDRARHYPILTRAQVAALGPVDERSYHAGFEGADAAGLKDADKLRVRPG